MHCSYGIFTLFSCSRIPVCAFYIWMILQIILESFPISSSGHLVLFERACTALLSAGNIVHIGLLRPYIEYILHIPTAIILCIYFFEQWSFPFKHIRRCFRLIIKIGAYTALADMVTVMCYLMREWYAMPHIPLMVGFFITACSLYSLRWCGTMYSPWTGRKALLLGCAQSIALVPGISRFGITYVVARWTGIAPRRAFQITMLIQFPLLILASSYSMYVLGSLTYELLNMPCILVMLGATVSSYKLFGIVEQMAISRIMWVWSLYMLVPICASMVLWK
jgi:undecaprenyl-diphosphatase